MMERLQRDAVILSLIQNLHDRGSWCGETHIQKSTYFLQEMLAVPLGFNFILYKHGPYSFDLSHELVAMRADGMLRLELQPAPYGPSIVPDKGADLVLRSFPKTCRKYDRQVQFLAKNLADKGVAELERLATALYVSQEGTADESVESRLHRLSELKPHISLNEAREAVEWIDRTGEELAEIEG